MGKKQYRGMQLKIVELDVVDILTESHYFTFTPLNESHQLQFASQSGTFSPWIIGREENYQTIDSIDSTTAPTN